MRNTVSFFIVLACSAALCAQTEAPKQAVPQAQKKAEKATAAAQAAPAAVTASAPAAAQPAKPKPPAAQKPPEEGDDGTVMIDSRGEADDGGRYSAAQDSSAPEVPGGIPSSYGQCKGVIAEASRTVLVFESLDDGAITFVQVFLGKSGVSWKLLDKLGRSAD